MGSSQQLLAKEWVEKKVCWLLLLLLLHSYRMRRCLDCCSLLTEGSFPCGGDTLKF